MHTVSVVLLVIIGIMSTIALIRTAMIVVALVIAVRKHGYNNIMLIESGVHPLYATLVCTWHEMDRFSKVIAAIPMIGSILLSVYLVITFLYGALTWKLLLIVIALHALCYACTFGIIAYNFHKKNKSMYEVF